MEQKKQFINRCLHKTSSYLSTAIKSFNTYLIIALCLTSSIQAAAANTKYKIKTKATITINIYSTKQNHRFIGTVKAFNSTRGLALKTNLTALTPGAHGFHLHKYATCAKHGAAAGSHWDPQHTNRHSGPYKKNGHLGDLPRLTTNKHRITVETVYAPRLKLKDLAGHSLMIHAGGDNYSDKPIKNGGGGKRVACGVIQKNIFKK